MHPEIHGPEPMELAGRAGWRYWIHHPYCHFSRPDTDKALSSFPLVVFLPPGNPARTPLLIGLQGMAAPYHWNAFLVPLLLDHGIACAFFDTPLAGERSLIRDESGDVLRQLTPLVEKGVPLDIGLVEGLFESVACNLSLVRRLLADRHGLTDDRLALFGVSLGCLLTSFTFLRDRLGERLLGVIGHADLKAFARSYSPYLAPVLSSLPARVMVRALTGFVGHYPRAMVDFLAVLGELASDSPVANRLNPMTHVDPTDKTRPMRFLVGAEDELLRAEDAEHCVSRLPNALAYVVPGLGHGDTRFGPKFEDHVRYYVATQLGDWRS